MTRIRERLARLEGALIGAGRLIVAQCGKGQNVDALLAAHGVEPAAADLLVIVRKPDCDSGRVSVN
ncbi:hypothetical protein [Sphingomonas sp. GM_Shp_1]|uniref:hypothetical protein n=1 Tax=Sphingomonas sp. GM_Shp_1 TaxID=2937381 RepID=UPI00226B4BD5|nr:hypothetical protein [Sphingomonas sp. GM_Shp_1]